MPYSNIRKLSLSGWLQSNDVASYCLSLKLQKFFFFYEALSKVANDNPDFTFLKGYKRGPVFSSVWGDYTKERKEFDRASLEAYNLNCKAINEQRARRADFIVSSLSENELSKLTHQFNIWKVKSNRIMDGEQQVELQEKDFTEEDCKIVRLLEVMYPDEMINDSVVVPTCGKYFIFAKKDLEKFTEEHMDTLVALAKNEDLQNPVFIEIDETGRLCVD